MDPFGGLSPAVIIAKALVDILINIHVEKV